MTTTPGGKATVLIVDDMPNNLAVLGDLLVPLYHVRAANNGARALEIAASPPRPDLILLDVMMPDMDGMEVLARLQAEPATADIPVIFVTSMDSTEDEEKGLALGAADYIAKPIRPAIVLARVRTQLQAKFARDWLRDQNAALEAEVGRRLRDNQDLQDISIHALARLAEVRDVETGNHLHRTQGYIRVIAERLAQHPAYAEQLSPEAIEWIAKCAPLHDIGKVGIPDSILLKPGPLDADERRIMERHAIIGAEALEQAERDARRHMPFLRYAKEVTRSHHERWDGRGYPDHLSGAAIPISARLMAVADVFDALVSARPYKAPMSFEEARRIVVGGRGGHFDPDVVDAFEAVFAQCCAIARRFADGHAGPVAA
jgi:putative two-component system response regulator